MKCVPTDQGKQLLLEVHAKIYGHHVAPRSLVKKAFRQGFTSLPHYKMQRRSSAGARDASSTLGKLICWNKSSKPSPSPGRSQSRASTW